MSTCQLCTIARGWGDATIVHEDERFVAFADPFPRAPVHLVVAPRNHVAGLADWVEDGSAPGLLEFVAVTARAAGVAGAYRVVVNEGDAARGPGSGHLHVHVVSGDLVAF